MTTPRDTRPRCWHCAAEFRAKRVRVESVLHTRSPADGGPYRSLRCSGCGVENGVLPGAGDRYMLYPIEGLDEPSLLDRIVPRQSREVREAATAWWTRNATRVRRFRAECPPPPRKPLDPAARRAAEPRKARRVEEEQHRASRPRATPADHANARRERPPREPREEQTRTRSPAEHAVPGAARRSPYELLGVEEDADSQTIRAAYRAALKLCHPDRVANLDPEIQALAHRKSKALRRAYETLLRRATD